MNVIDMIERLQHEIVDLTSFTVLMRSDSFREYGLNLTAQDRANLLELIDSKSANKLHRTIAILILAHNMCEREYWEAFLPLLAKNIDDELFCTILYPFPYGPGFSNAIHDISFRKALEDLHENVGISERADVLAHIMRGQASADIKDFLRNPLHMNMDPEIYSLLGPSWKSMQLTIEQEGKDGD